MVRTSLGYTPQRQIKGVDTLNTMNNGIGGLQGGEVNGGGSASAQSDLLSWVPASLAAQLAEEQTQSRHCPGN